MSTGLGDMIESGMLGFVGFFLGAIFLLLAFAILRDARRPSLPGPGVPD
jgi:predicted PurR-regulated permease PerM